MAKKTQQTEATYRAKFAISQSSIKDWKELPPQKWFDKWIAKIEKRPRRSAALEFGSLLDTLCFTPDQFKKRFIVTETKKPSDTLVKILTDVYDHLVQLNENIKEMNAEEGAVQVVPDKPVTLVDNKEVVLKYCKENEYYVSKPEQAYNTVIKDGSAYFEFLKELGKRIAVTPAQVKLAEELRDILFSDPITAGFFKPKKGCEVYFQVQIFGEFEIAGLDSIESMPIKGMLDIIHVNNKRKEIREVDLKFTNSAYKFNDFKGPVRMFDYPAQHSFYNFLLPQWMETFKDGKYKDYSIANPLNVVIDDDIKLPFIYEYNMEDLRIKRCGIENTSIIGWEETLYEIAWHLDKNDWTRPRQHILNGKLFINIFKR